MEFANSAPSSDLQPPGELARVSGIYEATHVKHRPDHEVVIIRGEEFPCCRACRNAVRFRLVTAIDHITHDWDFTGPALHLVPRRSQPGRKAS